MSFATAPRRQADPASADRRPWRRAILWLLLLAPTFFGTYGFANWLTAQRADVGSLVFAWERHIPFLAWTIVPYWSIDLFYGLSLFLPRTRKELDTHAKRLLAAQALSVSGFILAPLRFTFERPETAGVFGSLFDLLTSFDRPFNQAPSLHISLLVILWSLYRRYVRGPWRWLLHGLSLLIGVSVLTTYQHHFIDLPTGLAAGCLCVWLFGFDSRAAVVQTDRRRWSIAMNYLLGAIAAGAVGSWLGGSWLWLWWPAVSLGAVALVYLRGNPRLFLKQDGRVDPFLVLLFLPYLVGAWLNSRWWTRRYPQASEVAPGLSLSRIPSSRDLQSGDVAALVDCCAELPLRSAGLPSYAVPMLDLLTPEPEQLDEGVRAIEEARKSGPALVFCALGVSRSAALVVAWLTARGGCATISQAVERVREARPGLVLSSGHLAALEDWHARTRP